MGVLYSALFVNVYFSPYKYMTSLWQREDYNYCYLIPFVVVYLIWAKRDRLSGTRACPGWAGLIPLLIGLLFFWLGELGGEYYTMYISSLFVLIGLCWLHLGWHKLKTILFPIALIITMFPPPNFIYANLSLKLKIISSRLGVWILQLLGQSAYREGNIIDLGFTKLQVVDACNGLRYLFPLIVLAILIAYFSKAALWKKIVVVLSAIPISIFVNGFRIATVGLLVPIFGPTVAEGFFHDLSGWAIFMISLGILTVELWLLNKIFHEKKDASFHRVQGAKHKAKSDDQKTVYQNTVETAAARTWKANGARIKKFHPQFLVAVLLLSGTAVLAHGVNFREAMPTAKPFNQFPLRIGEWTGKLQTMNQMFINELDFSDYIIVDYRNDSGPKVNFYTAYYESQRKGASIHSPASCLPSGGWEFQQAGQVEIPLSDKAGHKLPVNRAVMSNLGYRQLSYYWFPMRGRVITNVYQMKLYNFWDALTRQRTDGALVRLITPIRKNEAIEDADARLQAFTLELYPVLNEFLPQ